MDHRKCRFYSYPLGIAPGLGPTTLQTGAWRLFRQFGKECSTMKSLLQLNADGGQIEQSRPGRERPFPALVLFLARLLTSALASQRGLHTLFLAGLQVKGVTFHFFNDVFLLHLALKAP